MNRSQLLLSFVFILALPLSANATAVVGSVSDAGNITLTPTSGPVEIVGLNFISASGLLVPVDSSAPFQFFLVNQPTAVTFANLGSFYSLESVFETSVAYSGDPTSGDLTLQYGDAGSQVVDIPIVASAMPPAAVPEPASIAIWFSMIGLVLWRVSRRNLD